MSKEKEASSPVARTKQAFRSQRNPRANHAPFGRDRDG
jgi:hypothetical protein